MTESVTADRKMPRDIWGGFRLPFSLPAKDAAPFSPTILINGETVPVRFAKNSRAKRITMRIDRIDRAISITLPAKANHEQGLAFARAETGWLAERLAKIPERVRFTDGALVPVLGRNYRLCNDPGSRRGVWMEDDVIRVSGAPEFMERRCADWLKEKARHALIGHVTAMAEKIDRPVLRISVIDPRSRWGSCTSKGRLAFSWRLVFAPEDVLAYVAAHEVAHLAEMNHSPDFWRVVSSIMPDYGPWRRWLKVNGASLRRFG